jgi:anion transporter
MAARPRRIRPGCRNGSRNHKEDFMSSRENPAGTPRAAPVIAPSRTLRHGLGAIALSGFAFWLGYYNGLPVATSWYLCLTICAICLWATDLMPGNMVAMMLPVAYILAGVGSPAVILKSWTTPMGWLIIGGLVMGLILNHTGLARRIALWSLLRARGSFILLLWGLLMVGVLMTPLVPSAISKGILMMIICTGICDAAGFKPQSRQAATVMLVGVMSVGSPRLGFYTGSGDITLPLEIMNSLGATVTWGGYFIRNFIPSLVYSAAVVALIILVMRPRTDANLKDYVRKEYSALGPVSAAEKKAFALFFALVLLLLTDNIHGISPGWIMMVLAFLSFIPGLGIVDRKQFDAMKLGSVFFVVGCMAIGLGAQATGLDKMLSGAMLPLLQGQNELFTMLTTYAAAVGLKFALTPVAAASTFTAPVVDIATTLGINPQGMVYTFIYGLDQSILPYENAVYILYFATGYIALKDFIKITALKALLTIAIVAAVCYPWWKLTGAF